MHGIWAPTLQDESYEDFVGQFSFGVDKVQSVMPMSREEVLKAKEAVTVGKSVRVSEEVHVESVEGGDADVDDDGCEVISVAGGKSASILDEGELQSRVQFDNFVGTDDPDDISDLSDYEWTDMNKPAAKPAVRPVQGPAEPPEGRPSRPDLIGQNEAEGKFRKATLGRATCALPPGWAIDAKTMRSRPPSKSTEVNRDEVQKLHHMLLTKDENQPITDADIFTSEKAQQDIRTEEMQHVDAELFGNLNTPTCPEHIYTPSPFEQKASRPESSIKPLTADTLRQAEQPPQDVPKWVEDIEPFALDPHFDYDNITNPTPKPMTPYEV